MSLGCRAWYPITTTNVINIIVPSTWEHMFPCGNECSQCIPNCTICNMGTTCVTKPLECVSHIWANSMFPCLGTCTLVMWDDPMWKHTLNPTWEHVDTLPMWEPTSCANVQHGFHLRTCIHVQMCNMGFHVGTCHPMWEFPCSSAWEHTFHVGKCVPMHSQLSHRCHVGTMYIPCMHGCNKCAS